jgi:dihydropteroate synthase
MGIINATPDSFYKGDLNAGLEAIIQKAGKMIAEGATIIDIGGQSTKPNATEVSIEQELERVLPIIKALHASFPETVISIDTFYSEVALKAIDAGASMVNDVSGGDFDEKMIPTLGKIGNIPYVCMHRRGNANTMQSLTQYENVTEEVISYMVKKIADCKQAGIKDFITDPGFGFAKTVEQNFTIIKELQHFEILEKPILVGVSRKSSIYKTLGITAEDALNGTTVMHTLALKNGANILRVHDVKEAIEVIKLCSYFV